MTDPVAVISNTTWRTHIMNIIIWLIVGGIIGWLASIIMKRDEIGRAHV